MFLPAPVRLTAVTVGSYPLRMDSDQSQSSENDLIVVAESTASVWTVWRSLTDKHMQWWPDMQFDAVPGAPLHETWAEDGVEYHATGHVVEVQDRAVFTFEWSEPSWPSPLLVRFELRQIGCGTQISVWECGSTESHAVTLCSQLIVKAGSTTSLDSAALRNGKGFGDQTGVPGDSSSAGRRLDRVPPDLTGLSRDFRCALE